VLDILTVRILAGCGFVGALTVVILGGAPSSGGRQSVRVVARKDPGRWAEVLWAMCTTASVLWPLAVLLLPRFDYRWPPTPDFPASSVFQVFGFVVAIAGGALFFASHRALGRQMTPAIRVQENHRLIQEGPYRYIRHPAYTAIVTVAFGFSLLFLSPILATVGLVLVGMAVYRADLEEELLSSPEAFGNAYREYVARTGRFLPRLRSHR
jgi:protein-S-isoprenylcysteine O-methyltransferase Ste14